MRRFLMVLVLAVALPAVLGGGTSATATATATSRTADEPTPRPKRPAIEVTCAYDGARVTQPVGEAGPKGVTVRFSHPRGEWRMSWVGALAPYGSHGSDMVAEMTLPIAPGPVRIACIPAGQQYHDQRWWADAEVRDPRGHWRPTKPDCTHLVGTHWHGGRRPAAEEREIVRDALRHVSVEVQEGDELSRVGYPRAIPRTWGLHRDGLLIGLVRMMEPGPDGSVAPNSISGCSPGDPPPTR